MKKRIISILLVLVMVVSLVPFSAFAETTTITITSQPSNVFVRRGGSASFSVTATTNRGELRYIWIDTEKIDIDELSSTSTKITNLITGGSTFGSIREGILGTNSTLTLSDVTENRSVACLVYVINGLAIFSGDIAFAFTDAVTVTIDATPICATHSLSTNLSRVDAVTPTCSKEGNYVCYVCNICGEYFTDPEGLHRTTFNDCKIPKLNNHALIYHPEVQGNCDDRSAPQYWICSECGKYFTDAEGRNETTLFNLQSNGQKDPNNHKEIVHYAAKAATCSQKGNYEYWYCKGCHMYFLTEDTSAGYDDDDIVKIPKDANNHVNLRSYPATPATCEENGSTGYYKCADCNEYFEDANGFVPTTRSKCELPKTGHNYVWQSFDSETITTGYHKKVCSYCGKVDGSSAVHSGGTASCTSRAVCSVCGATYGDLDPTNHVNTNTINIVRASIDNEGYSGDVYCLDCDRIVQFGHTTPRLCRHTIEGSGVVIHHDAVAPTCTEQAGAHNGNIEYWECRECHLCWTDAELNNVIGNANTVIPMVSHYVMGASGAITPNTECCVMKYNQTEHWQQCKYCGQQIGTRTAHRMTADVPTCHTSNYCADCGYDVGNFNPNNHQGGTEIINAREPDGMTAGYTGDTRCLGCGQVISLGHAYFKKCPTGCAGNLVKVEGVPVGCTADGMMEHYKCRLCDSIYSDEFGSTPIAEADLVIKSTGHDMHPTLTELDSLLDVSTVTKILTSKGFLGTISDLFNSSGKLDFEKVLKNIAVSDLDHCSDDYYHWLGCQRCGKTLRELAPELGTTDLLVNTALLDLSDKQAHFGGKATCQERAICQECGEYYGTVAPHDFYENNVCKTCAYKAKACSAPVVSYTMALKTGRITLKWKEVKNAKSYEIYCSRTKNGTYDLIGTTEDLSFVSEQSGYGRSFYYKVRAIGTDSSFGNYSDPKYCTSKCVAPTVKSSNTASTGNIKLTWSKVYGASKYEIWRATSKSGTYSKLYTTTSTSFTNTSGTVGKTYYYKVRAIASDGVAGPFCSPIGRTRDCARPTVTAKNDATTGKIVLTWKSITGAEKYEIWRATSKEGKYSKLYTTTSTSFTNTSAVAGKTYYYKVKAINEYKSAGDSVFSTVVSRCCDCAKPVVRIGISNVYPFLRWDAVDGADKYAIYRSTSKDGTYKKIYTTSNTSYTNTSAERKTRYYYKVVAISNKSSSANSAYSSVVTITSW